MPQSTATPALFLLLGVMPVEAQLDLKTLTFFRNTVAADANTPPAIYMQELITRQLAMKDEGSASWVNHIKRLTRKYDLPSPYEIALNPPSKAAWKSHARDAVIYKWTADLQEQAREMSTMEFLNIDGCSLVEPHPVWQGIRSPLDILKATVKAQLLVKRYALSSSYTAGTSRVNLCPLCKVEQEDTRHFVVQCDALMEVRRPYLKHILSTCRQQQLSIDQDNLTRIILDSTLLPNPDERHEEVCRNLVFKLHTTRLRCLGGGSGYKFGTVR